MSDSGYHWYRHQIPYENIDYLYGKYFWFAYKYYDYDYVDGEKVYRDTYKWRFEQFKSISTNKFIICVNDKCTADYSNIYEVMIRTSSFSPRDFGNIKYIPYTLEEFKEFSEKKEDKYNLGYQSRYNTVYFSDDSHYKYEIACDDETNLWVVKQYGSGNNEDFYNRFIFKDEKVKDYLGNNTTIKKIIPMTIEELYKSLKPCYKETYLENGYLYGRECYYDNKE